MRCAVMCLPETSSPRGRARSRRAHSSSSHSGHRPTHTAWHSAQAQRLSHVIQSPAVLPHLGQAGAPPPRPNIPSHDVIAHPPRPPLPCRRATSDADKDVPPPADYGDGCPVHFQALRYGKGLSFGLTPDRDSSLLRPERFPRVHKPPDAVPVGLRRAQLLHHVTVTIPCKVFRVYQRI